MKRILITGALGHIGSRFIHTLRPDDYSEVILLDNLSTQRYCSLFNLPSGIPFHFIEDDILTTNLEQLFAGVDVVIHLAAITDAANSFAIRDRVEQVNFEGTQRVAQACVNCGCYLIFPSTTSVYGTQKEIVDETCGSEELKPQSPYAESKLKAEMLLHSLGANKGLHFVVCRLGTVYGTSIGMRFHTAINKFIWQACLGQPITVWRTALHQKRPYLALGDAVRAFDFIMKTDCFNNEVYNVLTENCTVGEIVGMIRNYIPSLQIKYVDSQIMNQLSYTVSNEKFQKLNFRFSGSLDSSIRETITLLDRVNSRVAETTP